MNYISFAIFTDTPARLRDFLINRGIMQLVDGILVGLLPGMEWVELPNPLVTDPGPPPVYDTRRLYLVKFAHESVNDQLADVINENDTIYDWTKFGRWIKNNSTIVQAPVGWTLYEEPATGDVYKINGEQVWLVKDAAERFGVWQ